MPRVRETRIILNGLTKGYFLLLVVWQHLIGQVIMRCPPLFVVDGVQAVVESRSSREIDNIPQILSNLDLKLRTEHEEIHLM